MATTLLHLAAVLRSRGEPERALPLLVEALTIREARLGSDDAATAEARINLADAEQLAGHALDAGSHALRGLAALEARKAAPDQQALARAWRSTRAPAAPRGRR